jgi:hypothetical protein
MDNPGIYIATSKVKPERSFIFSATDGDQVWDIHFSALMAGKNPIKKLQDHIKENPTDEFSIALLFKCNKNEFSFYTKHFIARMKPYFNQKSRGKK